MARLECNFGAANRRENFEDYIREVRGDVLELDDDINEEYLIGRVFMGQILWSMAEVDEMSLADICDNDSQGLYDAYSILTNGDSAFREDLKIDELVQHVMFVHRFVLHPDFAPYRRAVLESSVTLFGFDALAIMWISEGGFTEAELGQLGFRKIVGQQLVFRQLSLQTSFADEFPYGQSIEETATSEHHSWVSAQTKSEFIDEPAADAQRRCRQS